jgi:small subunit ribosomal protein S4
LALGNNTKFYETPNHPFQSGRFAEERELVNRYGLKNKVELWRAQSKLRSYRRETRKHLANTGESSQEETLFFAKLKKYSIIDIDTKLESVLTLAVDAILERRLQTLVYRSGLANTVKQARQFVVHGHISLNDHCVTIPSYMVTVDEESSLSYNPFSTISNDSHPIHAPPQPTEIEATEELPQPTEIEVTEE